MGAAISAWRNINRIEKTLHNNLKTHGTTEAQWFITNQGWWNLILSCILLLGTVNEATFHRFGYVIECVPQWGTLGAKRFFFFYCLRWKLSGEHDEREKKPSDRTWGRAGQLLAFSCSLVILPEVFAKLNSPQLLVSFKSGELWWEVFATPRKIPVLSVKPSDENSLCIIIGLVHCIQPGKNLMYTRVNADRKWVIIGPNTDTTEKFLFHEGWNILRYMYILLSLIGIFSLLVYDFRSCYSTLFCCCSA